MENPHNAICLPSRRRILEILTGSVVVRRAASLAEIPVYQEAMSTILGDEDVSDADVAVEDSSA
jgi:hypothetical protein